MSDQAGTPRLEDIQFFRQIASDVRNRPTFYREAGEWLDQEFGAVPYWERQYKKIREDARRLQSLGSRGRIAELKSSLAKAVAKGNGRRRQELEQYLTEIADRRRNMAHTIRCHRARKGHERPLAKLGGFLAAETRYREKPPAYPTPKEAKRVLLMTWLMTDTTADKAQLGLTEFENWPWDTGNDYDESDVRGRRYASQWWEGSPEEHRGWCELAKRSWEVMQAESPSTTPAGAAGKGKKRRGQWPRARTQPEVARYYGERTAKYNELVPGCLAGDAQARAEFQQLFGPTAIARAIGNGCYRKAVENTPTYTDKIKPVLSGKTPKDWTPPLHDDSGFDGDIEKMRKQARGRG